MASGSGSGGDGSRNVNRGKGHVENLLQNIGDAVIADDVTFQQFIEDRFGSNQPSTPNPEFDGLNPAYNTPNINENVSNPPPPSDDFFADSIYGTKTPNPAQVEKAKLILKEQDERDILYALDKLADVSDGDEPPNQMQRYLPQKECPGNVQGTAAAQHVFYRKTGWQSRFHQFRAVDKLNSQNGDS
ncbi:hypothetical protein EZV62_003085 [Acer yangbiense]|uniref:Uncharacterized protein n=1 Tax=Acer yangbiense TaxID=1000413 RepID=A0A5C7IFS4_9ROSI|nr:hypothetical protein EZV62_003085 [Acer yangbiense]